MSAERISVGSLSESWPAPPREGVAAPLIIERSLASVGQSELESIDDEVRQLAKLPPPFRSILEVRRAGDVLEVVQERFLGLSSRQLVTALAKGRRLLPLDVWLGLADLLCGAWGAVPVDSVAWRMVPTIDSFGVDVRRRVVLFPEPHHSLGLELTRASSSRGALVWLRWENFSPEHVTQGRPIVDERSRVFCMATVLVELLTLERPLRRTSEFATLQATLTEEPRWRASHHPQCPPALGQVLSRALARKPAARPESLEALRVVLTEAAGCAPAPLERIANVVLGVDPDSVRATLATLRTEPDFLPPSWRDGGTDVLEDQLLEALVPFEQLPITRAPAPVEPSAPRVNLAGAAPVAPPRVNLASATPSASPRVNLAPPRRPWWQAIWPFGRP